MSFIADFLLGIKDFIVGGVSGALNGPSSWAGWVFPFTTVIGIGAGLATGNAAVALGIMAGVPLAAAALGGVVNMVTGAFGSMLGGVTQRVSTRGKESRAAAQEKAAMAAREQATAEAAAKAAVTRPTRSASIDVPTTEIMAPGTTPTRLAEAEQAIGRG